MSQSTHQVSPEHARTPEDEALLQRRSDLPRAIQQGKQSIRAMHLIPGAGQLPVVAERQPVEARPAPVDIDEEDLLKDYKERSFTPAEHETPVEPARVHTPEPIANPRPIVNTQADKVQQARDDVQAAFDQQRQQEAA